MSERTTQDAVPGQSVESVIAADVGSTLTHVCLIDLIEDSYRLVADAETPTTLGRSENDLIIGVLRAVQRLEQITQRTLLRGDELIKPESELGEGVDAFVATASAAPALECVVVGLTDDLSLTSAQRACTASHALVTQTVSLGAQARRWDAKTLSSLRQAPPDVLLLVGGVDTGPTAPLESAARVLATVYGDLEPQHRPVVVYAGNLEARRMVATVLSPVFDLRVVDNVRPNVETESLAELQRELSDIYSQTKLSALPGYRRLLQWCAGPVVSSTEALSVTMRYIARRNDLTRGVLGVDLGGTTTYVSAAKGERFQWTIGASLGTSQGVDRLLELSGLRNIARWLPVSIEDDEITSRLENARLRPNGVPQTMEDMFLTHALARQALLVTVRRMREQYWEARGPGIGPDTTPAFDLIAARGGSLAHTPQDGLIVLTLLDAIQPTGLTRMIVDWASVWSQLGALARIAPLAAAQVLERDSYRELGTALCPVGEARDGERAISIKIMRDDGKQAEVDIPTGTVWRYPLGLREGATIEVRPTRHYDIGLGRKGFGGRARIRGGSLGLIVDTRGRPLALPHNPTLCRAKMQEWLSSLIGDDRGSS